MHFDTISFAIGALSGILLFIFCGLAWLICLDSKDEHEEHIDYND